MNAKNNEALNQIGLEQEKSNRIVGKLNELLADYHIFYQNVRGFHWNIKGEQFFILHEKFEELYNDLFEKIDEIAERILMLGETPDHSYSRFLDKSEIGEMTDVSEQKETVSRVVEGLQTLVSKERELLELTDQLNDEGTNSMMSDYIGEQEKSIWMYNAFLK
ncbi:MAG: DNA starvation/stationary phase protection protein [Bacteroidales bacterium]|nr:DNA starvation/stationary phase protection protein [Bacteroidales bacterium]